MNRKLIIVGLYSVLCLLIASSCTDDKRKASDKSIYLVEALTEDKDAKLSSIADSVRYVKLEATDVSLLPRNSRVVCFNDDQIIISGGSRIYLFSSMGKFIRVVGNLGSGPAEYTSMKYLGIDDDKELFYILTTANQIYCFGFNGDFI